jgi:hypothetical protein
VAAHGRGADGGYGLGPVTEGGGCVGVVPSPGPPSSEPGTLLAIMCRLATTNFAIGPPMRTGLGAWARTMEK